MHVINPWWPWQDCKYDKKFGFKLDVLTTTITLDLLTPRDKGPVNYDETDLASDQSNESYYANNIQIGSNLIQVCG